MNFHSHKSVQDELKCEQKKRNIFEKKKFKRHKNLYKKKLSRQLPFPLLFTWHCT